MGHIIESSLVTLIILKDFGYCDDGFSDECNIDAQDDQRHLLKQQLGNDPIMQIIELDYKRIL